jgi:hypothetical protein
MATDLPKPGGELSDGTSLASSSNRGSAAKVTLEKINNQQESNLARSIVRICFSPWNGASSI